MTVSGLERARQALRRGDPEALLGERECVWLDVKDGVYRLEQPKGPEELAKDVAAFANTRDGGLILVGFTTRKEYGEEIVEALNPVPRKLIDLDRHRQLIATRVIPALREVSVDWLDCGNGLGVLIIDIPAQPQSSQLFAVPAPTGTSEVSKIALGVPVRRGDGTTWLRPHEIQHFVGLGWANSGEVIGKLSAALASIGDPRPVAEPRYTVGGGEPGWSGVFLQAFGEFAEQGVMLGEPVSDVVPVGPGVVQYFAVPGERFGWVLCAQPKGRPVVVAEEIWQALRDQGSGSPDGDALGAVGFPSGDTTTTRVVDRNVTAVSLSGGRWGRGRLLRETVQGQGWWWAPEPEPSTTTSASTGSWAPTSVRPQLRARVLAILPFADAGDLKITPDRLDTVLPDLPFSQLAGFTTNLSSRRGGSLPAGAWDTGPNRNSSDRFSYASEIATSDGEVALVAEVMMSLPGAMNSAVVTCAEVRIVSFDAWARALGVEPGSGLRWSGDDLLEFFVAAWETATELLPRLVLDPVTPRRWSAVPHVELWVGTDRSHNQPETRLMLEDVLDLDSFGATGHRAQLSELFVSLPAVPGLDAESRRRRARSALVDMAHRYGFMGVRESSF
ncbi:hypothetical protein AB0M80_41400 [Amycolatopsis sp. NPDC051045]|uniref:AlbA family DNA-binding domain-containing protein n=1 Tax=Amycolatopsis sp. NPDC051045 TaxID=3156922 RepID=UPI00342EE778